MKISPFQATVAICPKFQFPCYLTVIIYYALAMYSMHPFIIAIIDISSN